MQKFNIGDKVRITSCSEEGMTGEIIDVLKSRNTDEAFYRVNCGDNNCGALYAATELEAYEEEHKYRFDFFYDNSIVIVSMYDGDTLIERGHGHIIHCGADGIAQAASYAMKKLWAKMNDKDGDLW